jgi:trans-2,3-dihydro-3-hydroxyanthranilate isomerase
VSADYRYTICDVFTETPLAGNPLAVFRDATGIPEERLRPIAREINYSETVFVYPPRSGGDARIRIFTPGRELPFAGHPILGTAIGLAAADRDEVRLETGRGVVPVRLERRGDRPAFGWMTQPLPEVVPFTGAESVLAALGVARSTLPVEAYDNGVRHVFVAVEGPDAVAALAPDLGRLARDFGDYGVNCFGPGQHGAGGAPSIGRPVRWKTRMFAPAHGATEDPATGSAAGSLAVHLYRHGLLASDAEIVISQGAEVGRPSALHARIAARGDRIERVEVGGFALVVGRGELLLD